MYKNTFHFYSSLSSREKLTGVEIESRRIMKNIMKSQREDTIMKSIYTILNTYRRFKLSFSIFKTDCSYLLLCHVKWQSYTYISSLFSEQLSSSFFFSS